MRHIKNRLAFSMLELIFVIIILGIVSSIGAEIIAKVYDSYITQRAQHRSSIKTQLTLNQIANRLRYAIPGTIVRKNGLGVGATTEELSTPMTLAPNAYTVLQWVAYDGDSFEATNPPGWSGFCDLDASATPNINSKGSNFAFMNTIQTNLGRAAAAGAGAVPFAIYFPEDKNVAGNPIARFGNIVNANTIGLVAPLPPRINERYKLAWTSYALSVENGDLFLYYNFAPRYGEAPVPAQHRSLLLRNVTNFKFEGRGQTTRIKLCVEEFLDNNVAGTGIASCKEKAVF